MLGLCATVVNCGWNRFKLADFRGGLFINRKIKNKICPCPADDFEGLGSGVTVWRMPHLLAAVVRRGTATFPKGYFRGRVLDQYSVNVVSSVFRNQSATSLAWKGRSSRSKSRLSNSVISPGVLGLLILFNARKMCSLRRRLEFGIFFIAGSTVSKN